jgi:alpha/beta superfamily hydrolase
MTDLKGNTFFEGPAGRIEAILKEPAAQVTRAAIVCHPHPLFGGTMHNKVVYRIAKAFQDSGFAVLRFNFRGAGRSQGEHDQGRGEQDDLRAAIRFMGAKYARAELWLAGFSFGSAVMLRAACGDPSARALVAAGVPVTKSDLSDVVTCDKPMLFVQGGLDEFGSSEDLARFVEGLGGPKTLKVIEGADHFFEGRLAELEQEVKDFIGASGGAGLRDV